MNEDDWDSDEEGVVIHEILGIWEKICPIKYRDLGNESPYLEMYVGMVGNTFNLSLEMEITTQLKDTGRHYEDVDFLASDPRFFEKIREKMKAWVGEWERGEIQTEMQARYEALCNLVEDSDG